MRSDLFDLRIGLSVDASEDVPAKIFRFSGNFLCGGDCRHCYTVFLSDITGRDALYVDWSVVYFADAATSGRAVGCSDWLK